MTTFICLLLAQAGAGDTGAVRRWLVDPLGPAKSADPGAGLPDRAAIAPSSQAFHEVAPLITRRCGLGGPASTEGPPTGRLVEQDVDGDGVAERVFSGGCNPEPYYVVLKPAPAENTWAVWHQGRGRLLEVRRNPAGAVGFVSARDGYGVARESELKVEWKSKDNAIETVVYVIVEAMTDIKPGPGGECQVSKALALRSGPVVDDAPTDSGMGFDYPGNQVLTLAPGSRGVLLGTGPRGWRCCAFAGAAPAKPSRVPVKLVTQPSSASFIVGWLPP